MDQLKEFLPFLIPLVIAQFSLLGYTLYHILTHRFNGIHKNFTGKPLDFFPQIGYL